MTDKKTVEESTKEVKETEGTEEVEEVAEPSAAEIAAGGARKRDLARGYERRELGDGSVDFLCLTDMWTSRDERVMQEHVKLNRSHGIV